MSGPRTSSSLGFIEPLCSQLGTCNETDVTSTGRVFRYPSQVLKGQVQSFPDLESGQFEQSFARHAFDGQKDEEAHHGCAAVHPFCVVHESKRGFPQGRLPGWHGDAFGRRGLGGTHHERGFPCLGSVSSYLGRGSPHVGCPARVARVSASSNPSVPAPFPSPWHAPVPSSRDAWARGACEGGVHSHVWMCVCLSLGCGLQSTGGWMTGHVGVHARV